MVSLWPGRRCTATPRCGIQAAVASQAKIGFRVRNSDEFMAQYGRGRQQVVQLCANALVPSPTMPMVTVLARERPPTCLMDSGGVSGAWPTVHGHSQVRHPGCSRLPGANCRAWRHFGHQHVHLRFFAISFNQIIILIRNSIYVVPGKVSRLIVGICASGEI